MNYHAVVKINIAHPTLSKNSSTYTMEFSYEQ